MNKEQEELNEKINQRLTQVTRIEVIDNLIGRVYVNWKKENQVEVSIQDDGRTLKVFIDPKRI